MFYMPTASQQFTSIFWVCVSVLSWDLRVLLDVLLSSNESFIIIIIIIINFTCRRSKRCPQRVKANLLAG